MHKAKTLTICLAHQSLGEKSPIVDFFSAYMFTHTDLFPKRSLSLKQRERLNDLELFISSKTILNKHVMTFQFTWANDHEALSDEAVLDYIYSYFNPDRQFNKSVLKQFKKELKNRFIQLLAQYGPFSNYQLNQVVLNVDEQTNHFINLNQLKTISLKSVNDYFANVFFKSQFVISSDFESQSLEHFKKNIERLFYEEQPQKINYERSNITYKNQTFHHPSSPIVLTFVYQLSNRFPNLSYLKGLLLNELIGGNASSFLFKEIREKMGLAYHVESMYDRYTGLLYLYIITDDESNKKLIKSSVDIFLKQPIETHVFIQAQAFLLEGIVIDADDKKSFFREKVLFEQFNQKYVLQDKLDYIRSLNVQDINVLFDEMTLVYEQMVGDLSDV